MTTATKTHWKKLTNPNYIGAYCMPEDGKDVILTIKNVVREIVLGEGGKKEECTVAYFIEPSKPMILNRTNCKTITKIHGTPFIEEWSNKKIQIFVARVKVAGDEVDALRIRPKAPEAVKVDNTKAIELLNNCKNLDELQKTFLSLSKPEQADTEVFKLKETLKSLFNAAP